MMSTLPRRSTRIKTTPPLQSTPPTPPDPLSTPSHPPSHPRRSATQSGIRNFIEKLSSPPSPPPPSSLPPLHQIPCPTIVTYNATSLSCYTPGFNRTLSDIKALGSTHEVVGIQETKLLAGDLNALNSTLPKHKVFYSNNPHNTKSKVSTFTAGIATAVARHITDRYVCSVVPLDPELSGHALVVKVSLPHTDFSLLLINVRLHTGQHSVIEQEDQVRLLHAAIGAHPTKYTILFGDFNFVEKENDTTSTFSHQNRPHWDSLISSLHLHSVPNDVHTFHHHPSDKNSPSWSSCLDRFYVSHSEADLTLIKPQIEVQINPLFVKKGGFNAHLPTTLKFFLTTQRTKKRIVHDSALDDPRFPELVTKDLFFRTQKTPQLDPLTHLSLLKVSIHSVAKKIFFEKKERTDLLKTFQKAVALFKTLSLPHPRDSEVLRIAHGTPLLLLISRSDEGWNTTLLKAFIDKAFEEGGVVECPNRGSGDPDEAPQAAELVEGNLPELDSSPLNRKRPNALKELKLILPSTRSRITALRPSPDLPISDDPSIIGPIIQSHYQKIWEKVDLGKSRGADIRSYLSSYDRKIDDSAVKDITLTSILQSIHLSPNSAPGPDGIPFRAYKILADLAGPILLGACELLCKDCPETKLDEFNAATLILLPKIESKLVGDTRPISVNNTCNRIIARALFFSVVDASQGLIGNYQKMFLPGRKMTDHLHDLNETYYKHVQQNTELYLLFTDNRKAFDSIHHDFIIAVLKKQGFPLWFTNAVTNLLRDTTVFPSIASSYPIHIGRGVKQGCPLSPLVFILCYDVLNAYLSKTDNLHQKAAADDLMLAANNIHTITSTFPTIDAFTVASGLGINRDKTKILLSRDITNKKYKNFIHKAITNSTWPAIQITTAHKYLGITFGRHIQTLDIFKSPHQKALARIKAFAHTIRRLSLQKRIITFNVFISSLYSFVMQFYIIPTPLYREFISLATKLITPFNGSAWPYSQLCAPKHTVGFKQPLKDLWVINMSLVLKSLDFSTITTEDSLPWLLNGDFRAGSKSQLRSCNWDSPRFVDHRHLTLMELLGPDFIGWDGASPLPKLDRKSIHDIIISKRITRYSSSRAPTYTRELGKDHTTHIEARCSKHGASSITLLSHFSTLPSKTPDYLISNYIKTLNNAQDTHGGRVRFFKPDLSTHTKKSSVNPWPCYFCGEGSNDSPGDNIAHIFTHCSTTKQALQSTCSSPRGPRDPLSFTISLLPICPSSSWTSRWPGKRGGTTVWYS